MTLILQPHTEVSRPLSAFEYFHASVGSSPHTLETPREIVYIVEGVGSLPAPRWRDALAQVVAVNPGCRLRIVGTRSRARFESDGHGTHFRHIHACDWDGASHVGSAFLRDTPLSLAEGPMSELLVLESPLAASTGAAGEPPRTRVAIRANHAAMDGMGMSHLLHELFRALRDEPLAGSNAPFSDTALMRHIGTQRSDSRPQKCARLTGAPRGDDPARWWRRITVRGQRANSMARLVAAFAESARAHDPGLPCVFSLPINLRRHLPELNSTQNFGSMLFVPLAPDAAPRDFKRTLNAMLAAKMEAKWTPAFERVKWLPMPWIDWLTQRRPGNYRHKKQIDTCMISHLGYSKCEALSCPGFAAQTIYGVPASSGAFCTVFGIDAGLEVVFGLPAVYGSEGRFDAVVACLERHLECARPTVIAAASTEHETTTP